MAVCPTCAAPNAADARYCSSCGHELVTIPVVAGTDATSPTLGRAASATRERFGVAERVMVVAIVGAVAIGGIVLWSTSRSPMTGVLGTPSPTAVTAGPSLSAITPRPRVANTLCLALQEISTAQDSQLAPLGADLLATATQSGLIVLRNPTNVARLAAVAAVITSNGPALVDMVFPTDPQLVVELKNAYAGYGSGILGLKKAADNPAATDADIIDPLGVIADARTHLDAARNQADLDKASGTLACD